MPAAARSPSSAPCSASPAPPALGSASCSTSPPARTTARSRELATSPARRTAACLCARRGSRSATSRRLAWRRIWRSCRGCWRADILGLGELHWLDGRGGTHGVGPGEEGRKSIRGNHKRLVWSHWSFSGPRCAACTISILQLSSIKVKFRDRD